MGVSTPAATQAASKIFAGFLPRAFRRPVRADEVESYVTLFGAGLKRGENFDNAVLFALQAVMISPDFLFRIEEPNPDPKPRVLGDYELASRLSYFLWNSMPDQELFDLAAQGKLNDPEVLKKLGAQHGADTLAAIAAQE